MKVSSHRYRQSRQGATLLSSKWAKTVIGLSIVASSLILVLAVAVLKTEF